MTIFINVAAAKHLDDIEKQKARETVKLKKTLAKEKVEKCSCTYESLFKDCPQCGDMKQWGIE